jgi:TonB-linked SusC/RagA family outer membrane protein
MMKFYLVLIFTLFSFGLMAQTQTITGTITGAADGLTIPGVTVAVKGTTGIGTLSDFDGKYSLAVPSEFNELVFSFVGMKSKTVAIDGQTVINVQLETDEIGLEEVVVVGYGVQKKSLVTGAISKVSAEELSKSADLRVSQALQGKTSGVVISSNSGQPGSAVSIRIRGIGTNGDNEPLYLIDGLPASGAAIDYLNPSDIESVEVLKDAASAAIYGARGANGVILITTKGGKKNQAFTVTYDAYYGSQNPWKKMSVLESDQYFEIMNEAAANANQPIPFNQARIDTLTANTDWQDEMFHYDAPKMSHTFGFSGGSEHTTYSSSLSYFSQQGIVAKDKSYFDRITWRTNVTQDFGMLKLGSNLTLAYIETKGIDANDKYGMSLAQALNMPPVIPVMHEDGTYAFPAQYGLGMQEITNPVGLLSIRNNSGIVNKAIGGVFAELNFGHLMDALQGLTFRTSYGTEYAFVNSRSFTPIYYLSSTKYNNFDHVTTEFNKYVTWNWENVVAYDKYFNDWHINLIAGHSAFKNWTTNLGGTKSTLIFDDFEHAYIDNATDPASANSWGGYAENTFLSHFARANVDFAERYMFSATVRRDGSSRFGPNNKFGIFPSASAGWVFTKEGFFPENNILTFGKIRASWGQNGNANIGDFAYTTTMSNGQIYYFGVDPIQYNGIQPSRIPNPDLKWETSEQIDVALDLGFMNDKITASIDFYQKKTKDWLVQAPAPLILGNTPPIVNGGEISNKGIELELGFHNSMKDFSYDITLTGAYNKNEVLAINNAEKILTGGDAGFGQSQVLRAEIGTPMGFFWGYQVEGVFQTQAEIDAYVNADGNKVQPNAKPGDFKFKDQNGDGKLSDSDDRVNLGNPMPDFTGGLNIALNYKGFDFNMFWYTALGHQIWMAYRRYDQPYTNYGTEFYENRWTGEGTSTEYPRVTLLDNNNNLKTASDFYVEDADYLRLKNLSFGYTIPAELTNAIKISKLRLYVSAENLFTFTKYSGYDPEIGGGVFNYGIDLGNYPQARTLMGGINVTF